MKPIILNWAWRSSEMSDPWQCETQNSDRLSDKLGIEVTDRKAACTVARTGPSSTPLPLERIVNDHLTKMTAQSLTR